jgi:hypothetical protein
MDEKKHRFDSTAWRSLRLSRYLTEEGEQERAASWVKKYLLSQKEKLANPVGHRQGHMSWPPPERSDQAPGIQEIEDALGNLERSLGCPKNEDDKCVLRIQGDQLALDVAYGVQLLACLACLPSAERSCERRTKPPSEDEVCAKFDATARMLIGWINLKRDEESRTDVKA